MNLLAVEAALNAIAGSGYTIKKAVINAVTGAAQDLIALVTGKAVYVVGGHLTCAGAGGQVTVLNGTTPVDYLAMSIGSALPILPRPMTRPIWQTAAGAALKVTTQSGQTLSGVLEYIEV
jgi:hypothetical protein